MHVRAYYRRIQGFRDRHQNPVTSKQFLCVLGLHVEQAAQEEPREKKVPWGNNKYCLGVTIFSPLLSRQPSHNCGAERKPVTTLNRFCSIDTQ